jgi:hypothetical protein
MLWFSDPPPSPLRGRNEVGGALQILSNPLQNPVYVSEHIVVPKPQNNETLIAKPNITLFIVIFLLHVLSAVEFDNQSLLQAYEIDDVAPQRLLAAKLATVKLPITKLLPEQSLGIGWILPQLSGSCAGL